MSDGIGECLDDVACGPQRTRAVENIDVERGMLSLCPSPLSRIDTASVLLRRLDSQCSSATMSLGCGSDARRISPPGAIFEGSRRSPIRLYGRKLLPGGLVARHIAQPQPCLPRRVRDLPDAEHAGFVPAMAWGNPSPCCARKRNRCPGRFTETELDCLSCVMGRSCPDP